MFIKKTADWLVLLNKTKLISLIFFSESIHRLYQIAGEASDTLECRTSIQSVLNRLQE